MKKTYIIPALKVECTETENMIAASITTIGGNSGIKLGKGETPTEADVRANPFSENIFEE